MLRILLMTVIFLFGVTAYSQESPYDLELATILKQRYDLNDASVLVMITNERVWGSVNLYAPQAFERGPDAIENLAISAGSAVFKKYPKATLIRIGISGRVGQLKHTTSFEYRGGRAVSKPDFQCSDVRCSIDAVRSSPYTS